MAGGASLIRALAPHLYPAASLVEERGSPPGVRISLKGATRTDQAGGGGTGQPQRIGSFRRDGYPGPQANRQSCGGWTTKIQMVAAEAYTEVELASGRAHEAPAGGQREKLPV